MRPKHTSDSDEDSSDLDSKITEKSPSLTTNHSTVGISSKTSSFGKPYEFEDDLLPKVNQHQKFFTSINDCYSLFLLTHRESSSKLQQVGLKIRSNSQHYTCACGKIFQSKYSFERHIKCSHNYSVKSLVFRQMRYQLQKNSKNTGEYKARQRQFAIDTKKAKLDEIELTEEMTHMSQATQQKMIKRCKGILQLLNNQSYVQTLIERLKIDERNEFPFSGDLMETLRRLVIDNIMVFDRRFDLFLNNMTLKQKTMVFVYKLTVLMDRVADRRTIKLFAKITESVMRRFTRWVDINYEWVLKKHSIPCTAQIPGMTYCQCNRDQNARLFSRIYLNQVKEGDESEAFKLIVVVVTKLFLRYRAGAQVGV